MRYPRQRDYPRSFTVKKTGQLWAVRFVTVATMSNIGAPYMEADDLEELLGLTCPTARVVYLVLGMDPQTRWEIFHHELMHVAEFELGLTIRHETVYKLQRPISEILADTGLIFGAA